MSMPRAGNVTLEAATPIDPESVAEMLYATDPHIFGYLHGHDMELVRSHLGFQWQQPHGIFSHGFCTAAVHDDRIVGIELGFDTATHDAEVGAFVAGAQAHMTEAQFAHMATWFEYGSYVLPETPDDAYYLQSLAVDEQARGHGIGRLLLDNAFEKARAAGHQRVHLDVYEGNPAVALYEAAGMRTIVETTVPPLAAAGIPRHFRMELVL